MSIEKIEFQAMEPIREAEPTNLKQWYNPITFDGHASAKVTIEFHASDENCQPGDVHFIYRTQLVFLSEGGKLWVHRHFHGLTSDWLNNNLIRIQHNPTLHSKYTEDSHQLLLQCYNYAGEWRCNGHKGAILNVAEFRALNPEQVPY